MPFFASRAARLGVGRAAAHSLSLMSAAASASPRQERRLHRILLARDENECDLAAVTIRRIVIAAQGDVAPANQGRRAQRSLQRVLSLIPARFPRA